METDYCLFIDRVSGDKNDFTDLPFGDLEKLMNRKLMVYVEQETLFAPRPHEKDLKLGNFFNMNAILTNYDPKFGGMHYFFVQSKTGSHEEGLLNGEEIMRANTKISSTPLITKELAQYFKDFRLSKEILID